MERRLRTLKMSRRGKKISITARVKQLDQLMESKAKKRMITFLLECLHTVFTELEQVCVDISNLTPEDTEDEYNDIEDVRIKVETCSAMVAAHLESRADEELSASSLASSWQAKHAAGGYFDRGLSDHSSDRESSGRGSSGRGSSLFQVYCHPPQGPVHRPQGPVHT